MMRAFIFDMDGVIIDSEPIHSRVKMDTFHHFGLTFDEKELSWYVGQPSKAMFLDVLRKEHRQDLDVNELTAYKHEHFIEILESGKIAPVDGTIELIRDLKEAGVPLGLATSSNPSAIHAVQKAFHLEHAFDAIVSGTDLPKSKPDPAIYRITAEKLQVNPADCVVLEDAYVGVQAAKAAGMFCIGYRNPNSGPQDLSQADMQVNHIREISVSELLQR